MNFEPALPVAVLVVLGVAAVAWIAWSRASTTGAASTLRHASFLALGLLVLARPGSTEEVQRTAQSADVDVVFAVDLTTSMVAEDYDGDRPRLDGVKADIEELLDDLAGARFALVTFGADAIVEVPFTTDGAAIGSVVDTLRAEPYFLAQGSTIERPVAELTDLLEAAEKAQSDRARVLVVFGDGETVGERTNSRNGYDDLVDLVDSAVVLGYGTDEGGRMREGTITIDDEGDYVTDSRGDVAISRIDEDALVAVADDLDGEYLHRTSPGGLEGVVATGDLAIETTGEATTVRSDLSWLPAVGLGALALGELWEITTTRQRTRRWWAT